MSGCKKIRGKVETHAHGVGKGTVHVAEKEVTEFNGIQPRQEKSELDIMLQDNPVRQSRDSRLHMPTKSGFGDTESSQARR